MFFASALGDFDFDMYDELGEGKKYFGIVFHILVISINMLLLLNLVIAIMSDTYSRFAEVNVGLYAQGIIEAMPSYKNDKRYGGLICMTPPFNILSWFILPIYHCRERKNLQSFNSKVSKCTYFPLACIFTLAFFMSSLVLTPFAWIKVVIHKCLLSRRTGQG